MSALKASLLEIHTLFLFQMRFECGDNWLPSHYQIKRDNYQYIGVKKIEGKNDFDQCNVDTELKKK